MKRIRVLDKEFEISIPSEKIQARISELAADLDTDYMGKNPVFISILNGSFMFAADLFKKITMDAKITFLKFSSYEGTSSKGAVNELIGLNENIEGQHIVILEDIVDTGITLENIILEMKKYNPASIKVVSLLFKPNACKRDVKIDYPGFAIPNDFIVGYGLDYDGFGRNYEDIYTMVPE
jgi:hypoxanthine phosphoribosyltransferase